MNDSTKLNGINEDSLLQTIQKEMTWNDICTTFNTCPMSVIAVQLKKLVDSKKIKCEVKNNNIYYQVIYA